MTREHIIEELTEIFRQIFDDDELVITENTSALDIDEWDSLEQINLVVATEKKFDFRFKMDEVSDFKNVGEMIDIIEQRVGG